MNEIMVIRVFNASLEKVWKAWADPELLMRWWGPKGFTAPFCRVDFQVGGKYLNCMRSPEGNDFWSTGTYKEINPMQKIVYTDSFADENGNVVSGSYYEMPDVPMELQVTVIFEETNGETKMTLMHAGIPAGKTSDLTVQSWNESFDKLEKGLK